MNINDQSKIILLLLSTFPLGLINYSLKNPTVRLWYGLISGYILQYVIYRQQCIHIILATIGTYIFIFLFGRKNSAFWILGLTVVHLSALHIYKMIEINRHGYSDVTFIYMLSICKFSSLAFSYEDGGKKDEQLKSVYSRSNKVVKMPTLLETFSYIFYFPSAIYGPAFEFSDFRNFINLDGPYKNIPKLLAIKSGIIELFKAFFLMYIVLLMNNKFDIIYCTTVEYGNKSILYKFFYFNMAFSIQKAMSYGGWKLTQSSVMVCGLGYNPVKIQGKSDEVVHKFDKIENCAIRKFELICNPKERTQYWNRSVHLWLKNNLYLRLLNVEKKSFKNNKELAAFITFMVSAFWHGFHPMYFVVFFLWYIIEQICTMLQDDYKLFTVVENKNFFFRFLFSLLTMTFYNYIGIIWALIDISKGWAFMKNTFFLYPVVIIGLYLLAKLKTLNRKQKVNASQKVR